MSTLQLAFQKLFSQLSSCPLADQIDPAAGRAQEERLDFLRRVYARNRRAPEWPFGVGALLKLLALQVVPLAGLAAAMVSFVLQR